MKQSHANVKEITNAADGIAKKLIYCLSYIAALLGFDLSMIMYNVVISEYHLATSRENP